ncbi:SAM-dependent methyltransferase [Sneathiella sp. CAU 1612]|uniref:SAM-dependent methyltransferase n=1 Tax=Sneathiella sedimenti TaxID=2816034 RepID=A0ABS3F3G6_9PROT|nr:SAM-dependent methyltransferase [Sneathiella sedimenti]MBO0333059.1 SAM-dependent methyltransferase [Sneathiella sedimenti]
MNKLGKTLAAMIEKSGSISLYDFMKLSLSHPEFGYYSRQEPFGEQGDFITAPEISQMFGELIGLWAVDAWIKLGSPAKFNLVELGPGNGTLMADILRSARVAPAFLAAAQIQLVENSPRLRAKQATSLSDHEVCWHDTFPDLEDMPIILIANEFFDALPIHQYCYQDGVWRERLVSTADNGFAFSLSPETTSLDLVPACADGDILETCPDGEEIIGRLSKLLSVNGGAALIVDYGAADTILGDSFQAVKGHGHVDPLNNPGEADLTAHVKFAILKKIAATQGITIQGPTSQGRFLERLGIEARHHMLRQKADDAQKKKLDAQLRRLTSASEMGTLFKVMALSHNMSASTEGFGS